MCHQELHVLCAAVQALPMALQVSEADVKACVEELGSKVKCAFAVGGIGSVEPGQPKVPGITVRVADVVNSLLAQQDLRNVGFWA
jgi:hypothetical protein